jgi:hypothetical protein
MNHQDLPELNRFRMDIEVMSLILTTHLRHMTD